MEFLKELIPLRDQAYAKKRDLVIAENRDAVRAFFPTQAIPDLEGSLKIWAESPKKAHRYFSALTDENPELKSTLGAVKGPSLPQLIRYLKALETGLLPLAEEYLFHHPGRAAVLSYDAIIARYQEEAPERAPLVFAQLWRQWTQENRALAQLALEGLVAFQVVDLIPELRNAYLSEKNDVYRHNNRMALAALGDKEVQLEAKTQILSDKTPPEDRENFLAAYIVFFTGSPALRLATAYQNVPTPATRQLIVQELSLYREDEAKAWEGLAKQEKDETLREGISAHVNGFRQRMAKAKRMAQ